MFTKTALLSAVAGLAAAVPARREITSTFQIVTIHSGSDIQARTVSAYQEGFYLGRPTQSYCPAGVLGLDCANCTLFSFLSYRSELTLPVGNQTALTTGYNGGLSMATSVPGGQQIYIAADGAVGYTIPHSGALPTGAQTTGFTYTPQTESGTVGKLTFQNSSWYACPTGETDPAAGTVYKIYAAAVSGQRDDCIGAALGTTTFAGATAWEYN